MTILTPAEVEQIRQRAEAASPGPWIAKTGYAVDPEVNGPEWPICSIAFDHWDRPVDSEDDPSRHSEEDAIFIASARSDIPRLLADREVLVKLLARAHGYLIQLVDDNDIFIDPEYVERVNEFCKEIEDAGVLAQVEGRET